MKNAKKKKRRKKLKKHQPKLSLKTKRLKEMLKEKKF